MLTGIGTMALTSFMRDFGLDLVEKTQRDTIQGNIVSTFQVHLSSPVFLCRLL